MRKSLLAFLLVLLPCLAWALSTSGTFTQPSAVYKIPTNYYTIANGTKAKRYVVFSSPSTAAGPNTHGEVYANCTGVPGTGRVDFELHLQKDDNTWATLSDTLDSSVASRATQSSVDLVLTYSQFQVEYQNPPTVGQIGNYIWDTAATVYDAPGSMGEKLNEITAARNTLANMSTTALNKNVWTNAKAGYIDAPISNIPTNPVLSTTFNNWTGAHDTQFAYLDRAISSIGTGAGTGDVAVNENTGGANNLLATYGGVATGGILIRAYLASDYAAGNTSDTYVKRHTYSLDDGTWAQDLYLSDNIAYTLVFSYRGVATTKAVTP